MLSFLTYTTVVLLSFASFESVASQPAIVHDENSIEVEDRRGRAQDGAATTTMTSEE